METTYIRVGNEEYSRENHSYGLITMRGRYVQVDGSKITFKFQRNSGVRHAVDVQDRRLAKVIRRCQDLPGYELFQYVGDDGETHSIDSADVNDYLGEVSGHDFTAKDFRTWAGTVLACAALKEYDTFDTESQAKKNVVRAIPSVADQLGNTSSVCRKCYVHPAVLESYMRGMMKNIRRRGTQRRRARAAHALRQEETALVRLLKRTPVK
jgi:DNA topoisomerase I